MRRRGADCPVVVAKRVECAWSEGGRSSPLGASQLATGGAPILDGRRQPSCDGTSRMTRECQVRICEGLGVKFPGPTRHFRQIDPLPTLSACPLRSDRVRTFAPQRLDAACRYCCKSPKCPGANFLAVKKSDRRPPIDVAPITLPRSPASLSSGNEVPHIFTRKSRVQPKEILITSAKRLLQQNLPNPDSCTAANKPSFDHLVGAGKQRR